MTNLTGVPAFGGGGFAFRQPPDQPKPDVPQIAQTALNGTETYTKGNELPGQNGEILSYKLDDTAEMAPIAVQVKEPLETTGSELPDDILTGPTPAFQASVLEVELDLRNTIAEIAAKRTQAEDEAAIAPAKSKTTETAEAVPSVAATATSVAEAATEAATEKALSLTDAPLDAIDPETRFAGPAAVQKTPFDG